MYNNKNWYHLVGICGSSMNGIASYLVETGNHVTGSDINHCLIAQLPEGQIMHHDKSNISKDIDFLVYTSAVTPGSKGYTEIEQAKKMKIPILKRSELIGKLLRDQISIGVTGMHGKSTTSSMIADILVEAGLMPSFLIGAVVRNVGRSYNAGSPVVPPQDEKGKPLYAPKNCIKDGKVSYFVVEACEYDRSFLDMKPKIGVITNIDKEHLDYYKGGIAEIKQAFKKFIKQLPEDGLLVVWQEDKYLMPLTKSAKCKVKRVSISKPWPGLKLQIPGRQYLLDATLAARVAHELGVDNVIIKKALNNFSGASRRFEIKDTKDGVTVIDDYGHHPTEIKATIESLKELSSEDFQKRCALFSRIAGRPESACDPLFSKSSDINHKKSSQINYPSHTDDIRVSSDESQSSRIIMVFQPHQQQRTKFLYDDFVDSFKGIDKLIIDDVYLIAGREKDTGENMAKKMADDITKKGIDAEYVSGYDAIVKRLHEITKPGDIVVTQGATDIYKVGEKFLK